MNSPFSSASCERKLPELAGIKKIKEKKNKQTLLGGEAPHSCRGPSATAVNCGGAEQRGGGLREEGEGQINALDRFNSAVELAIYPQPASSVKGGEHCLCVCV